MSEPLKSENISLRPTAEMLARIDALARLSSAIVGLPVRRGGIAAEALRRGVAEMEREVEKRTAVAKPKKKK